MLVTRGGELAGTVVCAGGPEGSGNVDIEFAPAYRCSSLVKQED